jgi:cytochrome d ubiquinol oxidase subunit I
MEVVSVLVRVTVPWVVMASPHTLSIVIYPSLALLFLTANAANLLGWRPNWLFKVSLYALPLPWLASASGWFISEFGRQPWLVADVLPTWQGVSTLTVPDVAVSLMVYGLAYAGLLALAAMLTLKFIEQGSADALPINREPSYVA